MAKIAYKVVNIFKKSPTYSDAQKKGEGGKFSKEPQELNVETINELQNLHFATPMLIAD